MPGFLKTGLGHLVDIALHEGQRLRKLAEASFGITLDMLDDAPPAGFSLLVLQAQSKPFEVVRSAI